MWVNEGEKDDMNIYLFFSLVYFYNLIFQLVFFYSLTNYPVVRLEVWFKLLYYLNLFIEYVVPFLLI